MTDAAARRRATAFVLAAGTLAVVLMALVVAATRHAPVTEGSPIEPRGAWGDVYAYGLLALLAVYIAAAAVLLRRRVAAGPVVAIAVALQLVPLAAPLLLSRDAHAYWAYGRIGAVHGGNPYADTPRDYPGDPAVQDVAEDWLDQGTIYGPAFTLASEAHAALAGDSERAALLAYRILAAAAVVALVLLVAARASRPAFAAAVVGWNPLLALHFAGGAHNDAWMLALVVAALVLGARGAAGLAGAAWTAAIAIKWIPLVFLPLWLLRLNGRARRRALMGLALAAVVLGALAFARYGMSWLGVAAPVSNQVQRTSSISVPHVIAELGVPQRAAIAALALLYALAWAWLAWRARHGRQALALAGALLLFATAWLMPWYAVWVVPLAALEEDWLARALALGWTAYLLADAAALPGF